jgi:hypothetical protein
VEPEVGHIRGTGDPRWSGQIDGCLRLLEPVFHEEMEIVPLVEDLAGDVRIQLTESANLAILLGHELLTHRGDLDVDVVVRQIEVRPEVLLRFALVVPFEGERPWLVMPFDTVEVEQSSKLTLAVVGEVGGICWCRAEEFVGGQIPVASTRDSSSTAGSA